MKTVLMQTAAPGGGFASRDPETWWVAKKRQVHAKRFYICSPSRLDLHPQVQRLGHRNG
jgi:hypothetical protein